MKWKNPYIEKLQESPDIIFGSSALSLSDSELQRFTALCAPFARLIVELGSGSGAHLVGQAERDPLTFYAGFELRYKRAVKSAEKAYKLGLKNVAVLRTNAQNISAIFPPRSLDGLYVNFPDPWDRRRWKKHRLISEHSLAVIKQILKPGAFLSYKTDHAEYFHDGRKSLTDSGAFVIEQESFNLYQSPYAENQIKSEFEKLFISKGLPIHFLQARLIS